MQNVLVAVLFTSLLLQILVRPPSGAKWLYNKRALCGFAYCAARPQITEHAQTDARLHPLGNDLVRTRFADIGLPRTYCRAPRRALPNFKGDKFS